jgi:peroxiredoxin
MKRKYYNTLIILLFSVCSFAQEAKINKNSIFIPTSGKEVYFDAERQEISIEAFRDSVNSQKYIFSIQDSIWNLVRKYPRKEDVIGKEIPFYETKDIYGNKFEPEGKNITLLSFWNMACPPCIEELSTFNLLVKEFEGLQAVALTKDKTEDVLAFLEKHHFNWKNLIIVADYKGEFDTVFPSRLNPANLILDRENAIMDVFYGSNLRRMVVGLDSLFKIQNE